MKWLIGALSFLCISAASAADVDSETDARQWLGNMAQAMQSLNYDMSLVILQPGGTVEPYRWRHGVIDGKTVEHLSMLNGPGRDVVRVDNVVSYFEPNVPAFSIHSTSINGPISGTLLRNPSALTASYDFVLVGRSRVAGRATQQIRIISRDKSRYGYSLWLDQETSLPLKLDMLDSQGKVLEQVQITSVAVTVNAEESLQNVDVANLPEVLIANPAAANAHRWYAGWLPDGMEEIMRDRHRLPVTGAPVDYLLLSDGLIDVSVYVQPVGDATTGEQAFRVGSDTYFSTQIGQLTVTIVGKLPPQTANRIAQSLVVKLP